MDLSSDLDLESTTLRRRVDECELEIRAYLEDNAPPSWYTCERLVDESEEAFRTVSDFERDAREGILDRVSDTTLRLQQILDEFEDVSFCADVFKYFIECDRLYAKYRQAKSDGNLVDAVTALSSLTETLDEPQNHIQRLNLYKNLKTDVAALREEQLRELSHSWGRVLSWSESECEDRTRSVQIRIDKKAYDENLSDALIASDRIRTELKKFSNFLLNRAIDPIVRYDGEVTTFTDSCCRILEIKYSGNKKPIDRYERTLADLRVLFEFLHTNLERGDYSPLRTIGEFVCDDFSEILIKECLVHTIPNRISELQDYGRVTGRVEAFQKYLSDIKFFENENFSILHYANNIDVLFANKTSQYFLENARNLAKKDLGDVMSVGCEAIVAESEELGAELTECSFGSFVVSPFRFPRCAVSRSVQELLDSVELMMEQAIEASDVCARRLYYTARHVFELYMAVVPLHHKRSLDNMPRQIALFHNNCMYLAHHLLMLGTKWQKNLADKELTYSIVFCDQIKALRDLATHTLLAHMRTQKKQLLDTIRSSDLQYIATKDTLSENAQQAVRQCVRQLQVLKTVWSGVFPSDVYTRLITCLANDFVDELVSRVTTQEDITADVASQLTDLYKIVLNRLPQIYDGDLPIHKYITSWLKFKELIQVLGGNLATIDERWFNGTGPLALQFKPDEVKRLIRALFQNTTFRANLLSKIK